MNTNATGLALVAMGMAGLYFKVPAAWLVVLVGLAAILFAED